MGPSLNQYRPARWLSTLSARGLAHLRERRGGLSLRRKQVWVTNRSGYRINASLHEPSDDRPRPAILLVPGHGPAEDDFCSVLAPVDADLLAGLGLRVLQFSPVGRGFSWGQDDFCGLEGQDSFRTALEYLCGLSGVERGRVVVFSVTTGLSLAAPVLAVEGRRLGIQALVDLNGPTNREELLATGVMPPAALRALNQDEERFWALREPGESMGRLPCPYFRLDGKARSQSPDARAATMSLLRLAAGGECPEVRLNNGPRLEGATEATLGRPCPPSGRARRSYLLGFFQELFHLPPAQNRRN